MAAEAICNSGQVEPLSCKFGVCSHLFDTSTSSCPSSADIDVSVFATNLLGNGPTMMSFVQSKIFDQL